MFLFCLPKLFILSAKVFPLNENSHNLAGRHIRHKLILLTMR